MSGVVPSSNPGKTVPSFPPSVMPMARFLGYEDQGVGADRRRNRIVGGRIRSDTEKIADLDAGNQVDC